MFTILAFILVLSVLVLFHEFGHFFAARIFGVKADEFGWGFPPRAIGFTRLKGAWKRVKAGDRTDYPNTIWTINWLPLGGFVRLKGEEGDSVSPDAFTSKKPWQRLIIIAAGVVMNWLLAAFIISAGFMIGVPAQVDDTLQNASVTNPKIQIAQIMPDSPAKEYGLIEGDFLMSVNGSSVTKSEQATGLLREGTKDLQPVDLGIERQGKAINIQAKPAMIKELNRPGLGVALIDTATVRLPPHLAVWQGFSTTIGYTQMIFSGLYGLVRDLVVQRQLTSQVSGPVGIAVMTGKIAHQGFWNIIQFTALLSLNLSIINILPIPALDGGRAVFIFFEWLRRKKINPKFESSLHKIGFVFLITIIVLVTVSDVRQYGGVLWTGFRHLVGF